MEGSLVFLTSTSKSVPSGRNARVAARTTLVGKSVGSASIHGTFSTFSIKHDKQYNEARHRPNSVESSSGDKSKDSSAESKVALRKRTEKIPRVLGPQNIAIDGLLATATATIRHDLTLALRKTPSRVRDLLRCRHWAAATFALGTLRLTPEVHSAVMCLEHKVLIVGRSEKPNYDEIGLQKYGVALMELQRSLRDQERRMQPGVLAASHILTICEMLSNPASSNYLKFINGIMSLSNLQARKGDHSARLYINYNAGTILVEALLAKRYDATVDQPWSQTFISAGDQGRISPKDASSFADSVELIFSQPSIMLADRSAMTENRKEALISRALSLQSTLRQSVHDSLLPNNRTGFFCPRSETVGERVAVMLGLDDFISELAVGSPHLSGLVPCDNRSFYANVISAL